MAYVQLFCNQQWFNHIDSECLVSVAVTGLKILDDTASSCSDMMMSSFLY